MARRSLTRAARVARAPAGQPFVIRKSRIAGRGAFATRAIRKRERIIEYLGDRLTHAQVDARYDDHSDDKHHTFLFTVNRSVVIDATLRGNDSRFINHSCEPNCESMIEKGRVFIDAMRRIRKGEELTYDYAFGRDGTETDEEETTLYVCRCGAKKCRGTILEPVSKREKARLRAVALKRHRRGHEVARTAGHT